MLINKYMSIFQNKMRDRFGSSVRRSEKQGEKHNQFDPFDKKTLDELLKHRKNIYKERVSRRARESAEWLRSAAVVENIGTSPDSTQPYLIRLERMRTYYGKRFAVTTDILTETALQLLINQDIHFSETVFAKYCQSFCPVTYGEVIGVSRTNRLHSMSQYATFLPWIHPAPEEQKRSGHFGPKDPSHVEHNVLRLKNLLELIQRYGFIPTYDDMISGYVLRTEKDSEWTFVVVAGHHRVAAMTALAKLDLYDLSYVPVRYASGRFWQINEVIFSSRTSCQWPAVVAQSLNREDALEMFSMFLNGAQ